MKKSCKVILLLAVGTLWMGIGATLRATIIFDNTHNDLTTRFNPGTLEVGDEITLASTERYLTAFSFEYWGTASSSSFSAPITAPITAEVRFYENDGPSFNGYATPGTMFYDSGPFQSEERSV